MSRKRVTDTLTRLGLSNRDAKVYTYLAKQGPKEATTIANSLELEDDILSQSLKNLQGKGVVASISDQHNFFYALPFNEALDLLIKAHLEETQEVEENRTKILSNWKSIVKENQADSEDY